MHAGLAHIPNNQPLKQTKQLHLISFQVGITPPKQISLPELYLVGSIGEIKPFLWKKAHIFLQDDYYERWLMKCNYLDTRGTQAGRCETAYRDVDLSEFWLMSSGIYF